MARQAKTGLEYFSHDVDCLQDKKLRIIKAKYGLIGYGVFFTILEHLYRDNFFLLCDNDFIDIFIGENRDVNESLLTDLIKDFLKYGLFDKNLYIDYKVLTSERIQRNYFEAIKRRKTIKITDRLILIEHAEIPKNVIIVSSKGEESKQHVNIMDTKGDTEKDSCKHSANKSTQSKVKESKVNNSLSKDKETEVSMGNEDINNMKVLIKETIELNWMIYKPWKYERSRIQNILTWKDFWEVCEKSNMTREKFVINIINLASKLQYSKPINNWADLYSNYADVYNKALKTKNEILQPKRMIW